MKKTELFFEVNSNGFQVWNDNGDIIVTRTRYSALKIKDLIKRNNGREFHKRYGVTPTIVSKFFNMKMLTEVIPSAKYSYELGKTFSNGKVQYGDIARSEIEELLVQAKLDGNAHIMPLIYKFQESPKELKQYFGKGGWKQICKNTKSRNMLITNKEDYKIPSTLLKANIHDPVLASIIQNSDIPMNAFLNKKHKRYSEAIALRNTYRDTVYMLKYNTNLRPYNYKEINPKWSIRKLKEVHDECARIIRNIARQQRLAIDTEYKQLYELDFNTLFNLSSLSHKSCHAQPLLNCEQVEQEGEDMGHCVGSYSTLCARGQYIVYSLTDGSGVRSTLGITANNSMENKSFKIQQHYLKYNKTVVNEDALELADMVISKLYELNT